MSDLWTYFWPSAGAGLLCGLLAGLIGFRRRTRRNAALAAGCLAALALAALWQGPLGAAERLTSHAETAARQALDYYELPKVGAHLHRRPLSRLLILTGPADDFQTRELQRVMSQVPGVSRASWNPSDTGVPLVAETLGAALLWFLAGLLLAYLIELRRRYNAQWSW